MNDKTSTTAITDEAIAGGLNSNIDAILAKQADVKSWGTDEHIHLLYLVACDHGLPDDKQTRADLKAHLRTAGLGGNSSQFRQSKFLKDKLPKVETRKEKLSKYDVD